MPVDMDTLPGIGLHEPPEGVSRTMMLKGVGEGLGGGVSVGVLDASVVGMAVGCAAGTGVPVGVGVRVTSRGSEAGVGDGGSACMGMRVGA